ncbi:hypothetical protein [Yoonia litorea]|uniref:hypothetical protein n=1 Tax=Yoonia litorea TaxID=1123755 RepID=UPI001041DC4B|nr:hypothetical protein [Yoonia litorea]
MKQALDRLRSIDVATQSPHETALPHRLHLWERWADQRRAAIQIERARLRAEWEEARVRMRRVMAKDIALAQLIKDQERQEARRAAKRES